MFKFLSSAKATRDNNELVELFICGKWWSSCLFMATHAITSWYICHNHHLFVCCVKMGTKVSFPQIDFLRTFIICVWKFTPKKCLSRNLPIYLSFFVLQLKQQKPSKVSWRTDDHTISKSLLPPTILAWLSCAVGLFMQ